MRNLPIFFGFALGSSGLLAACGSAPVAAPPAPPAPPMVEAAPLPNPCVANPCAAREIVPTANPCAGPEAPAPSTQPAPPATEPPPADAAPASTP